MGKPKWKLIDVLTCKSLFGLGYRGERLIEPLESFTKVVESTSASPGSCRGETVELQGHVAEASGRVCWESESE